jgi:protein involved in polysaccharide export with SLBB domain
MKTQRLSPRDGKDEMNRRKDVWNLGPISLLRILLCLIVLASAGLAAQESPGSAVSPATPAAASAAVEAGAGEYIMQSRDVLDIKVYNLPELSVTLAIRPDGKIAVPLLDELQAAGRTPGQLTEALVDGYKKEFRNPRVTVIVRSFSNQNVYVGGEVDKPGLFPLNGRITLLQAILQAGGAKESAKESGVILLRNDGNGKPEVHQVSLRELIKGKPDMVLQPFDVVYVPKSKIARVDKWVDQHIRQIVPVSLGMSFSYLLNGQATIF